MWTQTPVTALSSHPSQKQIPSNRSAMQPNFFPSLLGYLLRGACVCFWVSFLSTIFFVSE
jgi:hypothetical protein